MEPLTPSREQGTRGEREGGKQGMDGVEVEERDMELEGKGVVGEIDIVREGEVQPWDSVGVVNKVVGTRNGEFFKGLVE